jgi:hypothetical protein
MKGLKVLLQKYEGVVRCLKIFLRNNFTLLLREICNLKTVRIYRLKNKEMSFKKILNRYVINIMKNIIKKC